VQFDFEPAKPKYGDNCMASYGYGFSFGRVARSVSGASAIPYIFICNAAGTTYAHDCGYGHAASSLPL